MPHPRRDEGSREALVKDHGRPDPGDLRDRARRLEKARRAADLSFKPRIFHAPHKCRTVRNRDLQSALRSRMTMKSRLKIGAPNPNMRDGLGRGLKLLATKISCALQKETAARSKGDRFYLEPPLGRGLRRPT